MIKITEIAKRFEQDLNALLPNDEIQFKIWADAGQFIEARRDGNKITYFINGNLRTTTSANEANDLIMGINGLTLEFLIPIKPPRTNVEQTSEELAKIKDGQYPFLQYIINAINGYFDKAQAWSLEDENGTEFSLSFQAGVAIPNDIDIYNKTGASVPVSVYIETFFVEGGVNSKAVKLMIDGKIVPYQVLRTGRSPVVERDVYAGGNLVSKNIITSTEFAIDVDFPVTSAAKPFLDYLYDGKPNVAHFVTLTQENHKGEKTENLYFMTIHNIVNTAQGIAIAGSSVSLMQVTDYGFDVPDEFGIVKFQYESSQPVTLTFTVSEPCTAFIAGNAVKLSGNATVSLTAADFVYSPQDDKYFVYLVTDKPITVSGAPVPVIVVGG